MHTFDLSLSSRVLSAQLTPHQKKKHEESQKAGKHAHIMGPAGAGKTFVALAEVLHVSGKRRGKTLFIARNRALSYFVGKWLCTRLASQDAGDTKRNNLLSRVHVLFDAKEVGFHDDKPMVFRVVRRPRRPGHLARGECATVSRFPRLLAFVPSGNAGEWEQQAGGRARS